MWRRLLLDPQPDWQLVALVVMPIALIAWLAARVESARPRSASTDRFRDIRPGFCRVSLPGAGARRASPARRPSPAHTERMDVRLRPEGSADCGDRIRGDPVRRRRRQAIR